MMPFYTPPLQTMILMTVLMTYVCQSVQPAGRRVSARRGGAAGGRSLRRGRGAVGVRGVRGLPGPREAVPPGGARRGPGTQGRALHLQRQVGRDDTTHTPLVCHNKKKDRMFLGGD
jgi:hypothetical protein